MVYLKERVKKTCLKLTPILSTISIQHQCVGVN